MSTLIDKQPKINIEDIINQGPQIPQSGQTLEGTIIKIGKSAILIDLGALGIGMVLGREIQENPDAFHQLKLNEPIMVKVLASENEKGFIEVSSMAADKESSWEKLAKKMKAGEILEAQVLKANRGGLLVTINKIQGFMPASQLSQEHYPKVADGDKQKIIQQLQSLINQKLKVKIIDLDPQEQKLIVSEKALEQDRIRKLLSNYQTGDIIEGTITHLANFGAFCQFKAEKSSEPDQILEGLIHISEIDWGPIEDPASYLKPGQKIKAQIVNINNDRISLSLKALKKDPWQGLEKKYQPGQTVKGTINRINRFGAFVTLAKNIQGLIPMSEFRQQNKDIRQMAKVGQKKELKILSLDTKAHRLALGLD